MTAQIPAIVSGAVHGLLSKSCPPAILGRVVAVAVNAVKRHAVRPVTHILKEIEKAAAIGRIPTVANADAATPIPGIRSVVGITTSGNHRCPTYIGGCFRKPVGCHRLILSLLSNLGFGAFGDGGAETRAIVPGDELSCDAVVNRRLLTTATGAQARFHVRTLGMASQIAGLPVAQIGRPRNALTTAAGAKRRFQPMTSQEVRRLVTEKVFIGDFLRAPTFT